MTRALWASIRVGPLPRASGAGVRGRHGHRSPSRRLVPWPRVEQDGVVNSVHHSLPKDLAGVIDVKRGESWRPARMAAATAPLSVRTTPRLVPVRPRALARESSSCACMGASFVSGDGSIRPRPIMMRGSHGRARATTPKAPPSIMEPVVVPGLRRWKPSSDAAMDWCNRARQPSQLAG
jgi:hypothetical protein